MHLHIILALDIFVFFVVFFSRFIQGAKKLFRENCFCVGPYIEAVQNSSIPVLTLGLLFLTYHMANKMGAAFRRINKEIVYVLKDPPPPSTFSMCFSQNTVAPQQSDFRNNPFVQYF